MRLIFLIWVLFVSLEANSVWWRSNFDEAHHEAVRNSKKLMVLLIEENSPTNKKILINTFMNKEYIEKINKEYISILVVKNQKNTYPIELLYTIDYPSVFFLDNLEVYLCKPLRGLSNISADRLRAHLKECK